MAATRGKVISREAMTGPADDVRSVRTRPSGVQKKAAPVADQETAREPFHEDRFGSKWTTMGQFVDSGFRYQLRRRPVESPGGNAHLTAREEVVVARVVAGESNKSIAFDLGVAPSTVGVLLFRAATKLGVRSREDLAAVYARRKKSAYGVK